jgi:alkyl hydroperoxide reductase subunit AhpF
MIDKVHELHNARVLNSTEVVALQGEKYLTGLDIHDKEKGTHKVLPVAGVFVEVSLNHDGEIVVDKYNMTSVDGVFAAGDITDVIEKQVIVAAGEGAKAAIQASQYLSRKGD